MAYGVYSDRGYREHILEKNKNTNKTEVFTQEDQSFTGRKTFLSGVTTSDLEVRTVEVSESLKVKGKDITDIIDYLPNDVSKENKLTTEDFVNSSIATNTAYFRGTFNSVEELEAYEGEKTNNDYAFVRTADQFGAISFNRYKYNSKSGIWEYEYTLNNSSFTAAQWDAINSGITAELVAQIGDGSAIVPSITQGQYNALTEEEKNNGQIREITDTEPKKVMLNGMNLNEQVIDDTKFTTGNVWSAQKTKAEIESVDNKNNYSTEETVIGKWIDGKPIYRNVLSIPKKDYMNWQFIEATDKLNIDKVLNAVMYGTDSDGYTDCMSPVSVRRYPNNKLAFIVISIALYGETLVLEYTKTTD